MQVARFDCISPYHPEAPSRVVPYCSNFRNYVRGIVLLSDQLRYRCGRTETASASLKSVLIHFNCIVVSTDAFSNARPTTVSLIGML